MTTLDVTRTPNSRVFVIEDGAGPANAPQYLGAARAGGLDFSLGDVTPLRAPSPNRFGEFDVIDVVRGTEGLPTLPIDMYLDKDLSTFLAIANKKCPIDVHVNFGDCEQPDDFDGGYSRKFVIELAHPTNYSTTELGTISDDGDQPITETLNVSGERVYQVKLLVGEELAGTELTDEVVDVLIPDRLTCGACGVPSDGCQVMFALQGPVAGSPGLPSELIYSQDGGDTWAETNITTLGLAEAGSAMASVGLNIVVISNASDSLHYAPLADILAGTEAWAEVTTGFNVSGSPNAISSVSNTKTWIAGDGGYIYFSDDVTAGVVEQHSGTLTSENLNAIHALNARDVVAVGANNAVLVTSNGGDTWSLVTGPAAGVAINTVFMRSTLEWVVGLANGTLYYTRNGGTSWTAKAFNGSGAGQVRDVLFTSRNVGYMAHDTAAPAGRILRTTNGGHTWQVLPEAQGLTIPANDRVNALAVCEDVNICLGGGLGDNGTDGFLVKFA